MKIILLAQGEEAIVDDEDFEWLNQWKWCINDGYADRSIYKNGERGHQFMHRLILNPPETMQTDHINHNKLDNRRNNLRICTPSQNQANKVIGLGNHSGAKGVCYSNARNKWRSQIGFHGKKITIGYFNNVNDAITAYAKKAIELYGEFACTG